MLKNSETPIVLVVDSLDGTPALLVAGVLLVEETGDPATNAIAIEAAKRALLPAK